MADRALEIGQRSDQDLTADKSPPQKKGVSRECKIGVILAFVVIAIIVGVAVGIVFGLKPKDSTPDVIPPAAESSWVLGHVPANIQNSTGYYDGHNHASGIVNWIGLGLGQASAKANATALVSTPEWAALLARLRASSEFTDIYNSNLTLLYVYQYLYSEKIGGIDVAELRAYSPDLESIFEELDELRDNITYLVRNLLLADTLLAVNTTKSVIWQSYARWVIGSETLLPLMACLNATTDLVDLNTLLTNILSAGSLLDFDASYVSRGFLEGQGDFVLIQQMAIQTLIDDGITYVEISNPLNKIPHPNASSLSSLGLKAPTSQNYYTAYYSDPNVAKKITVRWLPMYLAQVLTQNGNTYMTEINETTENANPNGPVCIPVPFVPAANTDNQLVAALLKLPYVNGVDYASPENKCFTTTQGLQNFQYQIEIVYNASKVKGRKMILHVHAGEGFGSLNYTETFGQSAGFIQVWNDNMTFGMESVLWEELCEAATDFNPSHGGELISSNYTGTVLPVHYVVARNNVDTLIQNIATAVQNLKQRYPDILKYVVFKLGHATHATWEAAQLMAKSGIWADVNLESNLATRSQLWDHLSDPPQYPHWHSIDNLYTQPTWQVSAAFKDHAFLRLLLNNVPFTLGTDGQGVEHSDMQTGYILAEQLIDSFQDTCSDKTTTSPLCVQWRNSGTLPLSQVTLDLLYQYQLQYVTLIDQPVV